MKKNKTFYVLIIFIIILVPHANAQNCIYCDGTPTGLYASQIGTGSTAAGIGSIAIGTQSHTNENATNSIAIGTQVYANSGLSFVIGVGSSSEYPLRNNIERSLMVGFDSEFPSFFVGRSPQYNRTGRVAIGNMTDPQAKLHIYSDEEEDATLFLEPAVWGAGYKATIWLGNQNQSISANTTEGLAYTTEVNHVFKGGDVYIEDIDKGIIMKSPDGRCWRGTLDNEGMLNFSVLESCPEVITDVPEPVSGQSESSLKVYPNPTSDLLNVEVDNSSQKSLTISLLDEKGRELRQVQTTSAKIQFYTGDLSPGIYFVKVNGTGEKLVSKVIKE